MIMSTAFFNLIFILDEKTVSVINGHWVWTTAFNVDKRKITNLGLTQTGRG